MVSEFKLVGFMIDLSRLNAPLREVDVEGLNRTVNTMFKEAFKLSKQLDGDQVVEEMKELIGVWKSNLPVGLKFHAT